MAEIIQFPIRPRQRRTALRVFATASRHHLAVALPGDTRGDSLCRTASGPFIKGETWVRMLAGAGDLCKTCKKIAYEWQGIDH